MSIWTQTLLDQVVRLYQSGVGPTDIARRHGLARNQVLSKLQRCGHVRNLPTRPGAGRPRKGGGLRKGAAELAAAKVRSADAARPTANSAPSARVPQVARAPHQNNGMSFDRRTKARLKIAGDGMVFHENEPFAPPAYVPPKKAWQPLPGVTPVPFEHRPQSGCRWPLDLKDGEHWCCGARAAVGEPYCGSHGALGTNKAAKKASANELQRSLRRYV